MTKKPLATITTMYNLNDLPSDRIFEELLYKIFKSRIKDDLKQDFDDAIIMPGVGEKGRDVLLVKDGKNTGLVQCKKYKGSLGRPEAAKEIIKFALYFLSDNSLIYDISTFQYHLAVSDKFSSPAINLLKNFKQEILKASELQSWSEEVIKSYKSLDGLSYSNIEVKLKNTLSKLNIFPIVSTDINSWLSMYSDVTNEYFELKKVIDDTNFKKVLEVLDPDIEKRIPTFVENYYNSARNILDSVKFIGYDISFNRPQNIKVNDLYVEPLFDYFLKSNRKKNDHFYNESPSIKLNINGIFKKPNNYVFLGEPGGGKSLTVKSLILKFMNNRAKDLIGEQEYIPFRIELRKYNEAFKKKPINFVCYLVELMKSEYQIQEVDEKLINFILVNKRTIFFFDGLDEVFDLSDKNKISESIVGFLANYKQTKSIITSRFSGYDNSAFSVDNFSVFAIQNFNRDQINNFIDKFYKTQIDNEVQRKVESDNCKSQLVSMDDELKSNPLILSLMSLLALNNTVIPDSKLKVYEACTNTLVEKRDTDEKKLNITLKIKSKQGVLGSLAYWRYCQMTKGGKVSQELSRKAITDYLVEKNEFNDKDEAEDAAKHFLEYAEKRSIYFDDNFTHKTFLEYYAADHIFRKFHNSGKIEMRDLIINKHIENISWHIVFELLISKIDGLLDDTDVLDSLYETHMDENNLEKNYFFLSILNKVDNVSIRIKRKIVKNTITFILMNGSSLKKIESDFFEDFGDSLDLLHLLVKVSNSHKNQKLIQEVILNIEDNLKTKDEEIDFYCFYGELITHYKVEDNHFKSNGWKMKSKELSENNINLFYTIFQANFTIERIENEIKIFGLQSVFKSTKLIFHKGARYIASFWCFLSNNEFLSIDTLKEQIMQLERIGITINTIKTNIDIDNNDLHFTNAKNLRNLLHLFINNDDKKVEDLTTLILFSLDSHILKSLKTEFVKSLKSNSLFEKVIKLKKSEEEELPF